jgi:hypothetical protein
MGAPRGHEPYNKNGEGGCPKKHTKEFIEAEATAFENWLKAPGSLYFKRFAFDRGYSPQRLSEFAAINKRFAEVYAFAKEWQEIRLAEGGLTGEFNGGFCKFVMGNVCGWTDRTETKVSGDAQNPLSFILEQVSGTSKDLIDVQDE